MKRRFLTLVGMLMLAGCDNSPAEGVPSFDALARWPAGEATPRDAAFATYLLPLATLERNVLPDFHAGKALAHQPWVTAPTTTDARDGLGPLYNARTCLDCHVNGGRGRIPEQSDEPVKQAVISLSTPSTSPPPSMQPEPVYGGQLQTQSTALAHQLRGQAGATFRAQDVRPEARVFVDWVAHTWTYPDGHRVSLRSPVVRIEELAYGAFVTGTQMSFRNAPSLAGAGLIEAIPARQIAEYVDQDDANRDGISGRTNLAWDSVQGAYVPGRLGWKANHANLMELVSAAFANDVGLSNPRHPEQPCTVAQQACLAQVTGDDAGGFELPDALLSLVVNFTRHLGVPETRHLKQQVKGRALFHQVGCAQCHRPSYQLDLLDDKPALSGLRIWPYSDFLLHDMGEALSDGRIDQLAHGTEWRTAPLWGAGLAGQVNGAALYLHDGRARTLEEAILWHGGEADTSRQRFSSLTATQRAELLAFVQAL